MSTHKDINPKTQPDTKGADCRTESENHPAQGLACDEDTIDMIHHRNEGKKARQQQPEPAEEPDYDAEGMAPHN